MDTNFARFTDRIACTIKNPANWSELAVKQIKRVGDSVGLSEASQVAKLAVVLWDSDGDDVFKRALWQKLDFES